MGNNRGRKISDFEACSVYRASSRMARATLRLSCLTPSKEQSVFIKVFEAIKKKAIKLGPTTRHIGIMVLDGRVCPDDILIILCKANTSLKWLSAFFLLLSLITSFSWGPVAVYEKPCWIHTWEQSYNLLKKRAHKISQNYLVCSWICWIR